jgi:uncharacterized DUF497 family protein
MDYVFESFEGFEWDAGNRNKNHIKHSVLNSECEQIFFNQPVIVLEGAAHSVVEKRWAAFGKTDEGRLLVVIFTERKRLLRVVSARDTDCVGQVSQPDRSD